MTAVNGWGKMSLDAIISVIESGSRPKGGVSSDHGDIPSLGGENIIATGGINIEDVNLVPLDFYKRMSKGHLIDCDVLINKDGAQTGKVGFYQAPDNTPACINEHLFLLRGNPARIDQKYLYYSLLSQEVQHQIRSQISGSAQPGLKSGFIKKVIANIPDSLHEQRKITDILSTVDRAIKGTEALIAKQERIKTGLMQDLLTKGIDENGIIRSEETHEFKDSPLGRIPVEWEVVPISTVLSKNPENGFSPVESYEWNGFYMLGLGCLTTSGFKPVQLKYAPPATANSKKATLTPGDFLISRSNTRELVGLVGIYNELGAPCIYPDLMVRLVFSDDVLMEYMEQVFMSFILRRQIVNAATGTSGSMVKISGKIIKGFVFPKPYRDEQNRILGIVNKQASMILENGNIRNKLKALKTALMQDLLTGRKRVTALLDKVEAASA